MLNSIAMQMQHIAAQSSRCNPHGPGFVHFFIFQLCLIS